MFPFLKSVIPFFLSSSSFFSSFPHFLLFYCSAYHLFSIQLLSLPPHHCHFMSPPTVTQPPATTTPLPLSISLFRHSPPFSSRFFLHQCYYCLPLFLSSEPFIPSHHDFLFSLLFFFFFPSLQFLLLSLFSPTALLPNLLQHRCHNPSRTTTPRLFSSSSSLLFFFSYFFFSFFFLPSTSRLYKISGHPAHVFLLFSFLPFSPSFSLLPPSASLPYCDSSHHTAPPFLLFPSFLLFSPFTLLFFYNSNKLLFVQ